MVALNAIASCQLVSNRSGGGLGKVGRPRKPRTGFEKAEVYAFLAEGERIAGAYVVARAGKPRSSVYTPLFDFWLFINLTGLRGYYAFLGAMGGEQRVFRSFDRLHRILREMGYLGPVCVYHEDDPRRPAVARGATRRRPGDKAAAE